MRVKEFFKFSLLKFVITILVFLLSIFLPVIRIYNPFGGKDTIQLYFIYSFFLLSILGILFLIIILLFHLVVSYLLACSVVYLLRFIKNKWGLIVLGALILGAILIGVGSLIYQHSSSYVPKVVCEKCEWSVFVYAGDDTMTYWPLREFVGSKDNRYKCEDWLSFEMSFFDGNDVYDVEWEPIAWGDGLGENKLNIDVDKGDRLEVRGVAENGRYCAVRSVVAR